MNLGISGKRALVTAGSRGMGRACASALAAEGCEVFIVARKQPALDRAAAEIAQATGT